MWASTTLISLYSSTMNKLCAFTHVATQMIKQNSTFLNDQFCLIVLVGREINFNVSATSAIVYRLSLVSILGSLNMFYMLNFQNAAKVPLTMVPKQMQFKIRYF